MAEINDTQPISMVGGGRRRGDLPMAVTKRRRVWPHWRRTLKWAIGELSPLTRFGLYLAIIFWSAWGFKKIEPVILPVVEDFTITSSTYDDDSVHIAGDMRKVRDCRFVEVVGYSNQHLVNVRFTETINTVSRVQGAQAWGVWEITPPVKQLKLFALHDCWSGKVTTKLYEGELVK